MREHADTSEDRVETSAELSALSEAPARELLDSAGRLVRNGVLWARAGRGGKRLRWVIEWVESASVPPRLRSLITPGRAAAVAEKCKEVRWPRLFALTSARPPPAGCEICAVQRPPQTSGPYSIRARPFKPVGSVAAGPAAALCSFGCAQR
jgi:hypothetical protein